MNLMLTQGNALRIPLADESVHCCVTSPPYFSLRDYGIDGQLGMEASLEEYIENMVEVFREVKRVMRHDSVLFLNMGDSYVSQGGPVVNQLGDILGQSKARRDSWTGNQKSRTAVQGLKPKDLMGVPWRVAFALQADGWWLRSDIIWSKPNPMPESVTDRPTKAHEYLFLLTKSKTYYYDADAVRETPIRKGGPPEAKRWRARDDSVPAGSTLDGKTAGTHPSGRNRRTVWHIATAPYSGAHFATYPPALVEPCIKAGTSERGVCPECGAPWERVTEKKFIPQPDVSAVRGIKGAPGQKPMDDSNQWDGMPRGSNRVSTLGWQPTCDCVSHDPIPATVFDPFAGSGTTLQVARQLGRNGIGLDLSLEYLHLARQRLSLDALEAWTEGVGHSDNGKDGTHKNKNVPGQTTHSLHAARKEKGVTDLPMFEELAPTGVGAEVGK